MASSPNRTLTYLVEGQAKAEITVNEILNRLDMTSPTWRVINKTTTTPPGSPADGDVYLVAAGATGVWSGHDGKIAGYYSGWVFITVLEGDFLYDKATNVRQYYDSTAWQTL